MSRLRTLVPLIAFLAGPALADTFVRDDIITEPTPNHFSLCHEHQCAALETLSLAAREWASIKQVFRRRPETPEAERKAIGQAIARLETISGKRTGTGNDKGGDLEGLGQPGQMDCIDESINTTTYLRILERERLLRWHTVEDRATRGWFIRGWPHTTAVIRDRQSGEFHAVDSWFRDNGQPPYILPLKQWKDGWDPDKDQPLRR
jgi:hypothetical protein